jgi:hypothetical protein
MKDERKQFFFWLGVFVLPLFWSWFTLSRKFTRRERLVAFLWLAVFGVWLLHERRGLVEQFETVSFIYPVILGWVTVALYVWLLFRTGFPVTIIEVIVLVDVVGVIQPSILFVDLVGQPFEWRWLLPAGFAILMHLILDPLGLGRGSREAEQTSTPS